MVNPDAYLPSMLELLKRLVLAESPSQDKKGVDEVGLILLDSASSLGATIATFQNDTSGDHILARFPSRRNSIETDHEKGILLLCHMDTVYPLGTISHMPFYEKDGFIFGPGVADMKSGAVIGLHAIRSLQENNLMPPFPINILFTSDEEIGSQTSRKLIEKLASESKLVIVLEPGMPDGAVKTWRKGVGEFHLVAHGKSAHAGGDHEKGRNAIEELAHQVIAIQKLTDYSLGTTLNVGVCQGGSVVNVVPETAWLDVDLRVMQPGEAERITDVIFGLKPVLSGTTLEITGKIERPPMPFNELMKNTFEQARVIASREGLSLMASGTGGASDANFVAPLGIPVLDGFGAIGGNYHSAGEYILTDSLLSRTRLVAALLQHWN